MPRSFYPGELRSIVRILEGLDTLDAGPVDPKADQAVQLKSGLEIINADDDVTIGKVVDEVGGAWSFVPVEPA